MTDDTTKIQNKDASQPDDELLVSEARFQALFHQAPVGISIEDYSALRLDVEKIVEGNVGDLRLYLSDNPDVLCDLVKKIKITEANAMLVDMYRADTMAAFMAYGNSLDYRQGDQWVEYYSAEIASFWAGGSEYRGVICDTCMDGSHLETLCMSRLTEGHGGGWGEVITSFEDMTQRHETEKKLGSYRDNLAQRVREQNTEIVGKNVQLEVALETERENNELQRQYISILSHEFRTSLAIIDGMARRVSRKWGELSQHDVDISIDNIRASVSRMLTQIDTTLTSSRVQKGMMELDFNNCNLRTMISEICHRQKIVSDNIDVTVDLTSLPEMIEAIPNAIEHIFSNLLSNAIKYSPEKGTVEVAGIATVTDVFISVRDFGVGIPRADMKNLFRQYFRAATAKGFQGTGIGLHLVRQLVELQNGSINVDSIEGRGSIFTVRLPIRQSRETCDSGC